MFVIKIITNGISGTIMKYAVYKCSLKYSILMIFDTMGCVITKDKNTYIHNHI
jgi:hypothetical protein